MREEKLNIASRRFCSRLKPFSGWPPLIALIDLMFLLLLFFFLSTSFVRVSGIKVELPQVRAASTADLERYVITIVPQDKNDPSKPCLIYFNDMQLSLEKLRLELNTIRSRSRSATVIVMADKNVPQGEFINVMAAAQSAQLQTFIPVASPTQKADIVFNR